MKHVYRHLFIALSAAMFFVPQMEISAANPPAKPQKVELKKIDWKPLQQAVNDAIKAKNDEAYKKALKAIEDQDPLTFGKVNALINAVNAKKDPNFAASYYKDMLKWQLSDAERTNVLRQLANAYRNQAAAAIKAKVMNKEAFEQAIKNLEALPDEYKDKFGVLVDAASFCPVFARAYLPKMKPSNDKEKMKLEQAIFNNRIALANLHAKNRDRTAFQAIFKEIEALPDNTEGKLTALASLAKYRDGNDTRAYLESLLKKTSDPAESFQILACLRETAPVNSRPYNFDDKDNYAFAKSVWFLQKALIEKDEALPQKERKLLRVRNAAMGVHAADFAQKALEFGDYTFFEELLGIWYKSVGDADVNCALMRAKNAVRKHDSAVLKNIRETTVPLILKQLENPKINDWHRRNLTKKMNAIIGLSVFNEKMDFSAYDKAVSNGKETSAADRYRMLSHVSSEAFRAGRFDISQAIVREIYGNMIKPEKFQRLTFKIEYAPDGPKTADAWLRSASAQWNALEMRFLLYASYFEDSHDMTAKKLLKGTEGPAVPEENRAGVQFTYDDEALHIFVRVNDPAAHEITEGKRKGPTFEMLFRPGEDAAYHSDYLMNFPDTEQTFPQDWQRPGLNYMLTMDLVRRDTAVGRDSIAVHYAIPFSAFYDKLPGDGRDWTFGLQVWGKSALTLSCGVVHELSRMGRIDFKLTPAQKIAIKRLILKKAMNHAMKLYNTQGEAPRLWEDPVIGDKVFYDQEIKPMFDDLQTAAKKLDELKDGEVDEFYGKYAQLGLKLEYIAAAKRAAYLRKALLK